MERLSAVDQLMVDQLLHLGIGVVITVLVAGIVGQWLTQAGILVLGVTAGILVLLAFVVEQRLKATLQAADNCSCISCRGDEA